MKALFLCYSGCSTCRRAQKWLDANQISYDERPIKEQHPSADELRAWQEKSGLPLNKFFNTSGQKYRELGLSQRLAQMTDAEKLALLAADGMLVKRPLLVLAERVLVGFKESEWESAVKEAKE